MKILMNALLRLIAISAMSAAAILSGCAISGGGVEGRFIQDGLPKRAKIYKASMGDVNDRQAVAGTEADEMFPLDWNFHESPAPCSAIKAVHYWASGMDKDEISMRLVGHQYGGLYYPSPPSGITWLTPELWAEPVKKDEAEELARYCGVKFVIRRG